MKTRREHFLGARSRKRDRSPGERGSITFIFIALLAIMMILVTAETTALHHLHREVKFLEQQQLKRLNGSTTNAVALAIPPTK